MGDERERGERESQSKRESQEEGKSGEWGRKRKEREECILSVRCSRDLEKAREISDVNYLVFSPTLSNLRFLCFLVSPYLVLFHQ